MKTDQTPHHASRDRTGAEGRRAEIASWSALRSLARGIAEEERRLRDADERDRVAVQLARAAGASR
jgi:hypothetical protein